MIQVTRWHPRPRHGGLQKVGLSHLVEGRWESQDLVQAHCPCGEPLKPGDPCMRHHFTDPVIVHENCRKEFGHLVVI